MASSINTFEKIFKNKTIRKQILFVIFVLVLFRLLSNIPIPGADPFRLSQFLDSGSFLGIFNLLSGGGLSSLSIIMLGVGPYITSSIIMQVLSFVSPKIKSLYQEEGEIGRKKVGNYTRLLTLPLAIVQSISLIVLLSRQGVLPEFTLINMVINTAVAVGGSFFLMWLADLSTEFGIGNGMSFVIFAGIVASIPKYVGQVALNWNPSDAIMYIIFGIFAVLLIAGVIFITEAERPVPVTYARQAQNGGRVFGATQTYIPLRVNQAGVIPIIFALSILLFPQILGSLFAGSSYAILAKAGALMTTFSQTTWAYSIVYFVLVVLFTYFYTAVTFDPKQISENLQRSGAFIPGIRPGIPTRDYLGHIVTRITLVGSIFLGIIAVLPLIAKEISGNQALAIGGTALLIVVSVVIDIIKKVEAQMSSQEYY
ncbi:preprotein translocase subunit SecY [Candidatus Nomurabacteria bacterium RIFCSPHIGHO2_02_FULL_33_12]|uniref:Protein translocase subunit SecY n=1 Tax=Candidatus Nomurabacteria bacterium RIFCSPLOWO2_01_FULL_33_17 TaxID=1801764 RepID=A0A1F6WQ17_9BACT|nr:MAG: preprotein translocase subunit SecY [Candidatus Nomurabacteria bacterium RIFCSPHIGHO2_02_FULL_33_12]OGI83835.1 MAG: preprotein translocase subunit SecY [Candidatus Nomurabacteria bacterium RIFCSPLOWO2_01_FULL_33_17]